jgi:hypothetical protein
LPNPDLVTPNFAWSIGDVTPYSGVLTPGIFVVCTSRFSPGGAYTYLVEADPVTEKFVRSVVMQPGECRVVAESKNRGGKSDTHVIHVSPVSAYTPDGYVLINSDCNVDCDHSAQASNPVLGGDGGAVVKYYFRISVLGAGGHGGTGTLNFDFD